ncbi:MAG: NTP transferase domain-containing protein [Chloroflexi bacterium]|nr:NTP transferase domain-containing protein [Chloroflexota bacterium]
MHHVQSVILAGGKGTRMDVLCHFRPKPMLPFAGKFHVIDFTLSNCVYSGVGNIAVLTDYQRSHIANYLGRWATVNFDPASFRILEPQKGSYKGTADAVYQNLDSFYGADKVLVLAGDHIYKLDYRQMLAFHDSVRADVTVGVVQVPIEEAHRFGTVATEADSRIYDFLEKSPVSQSNLASMGIYIFNRDVLASYVIDDAANHNSRHDFGYSILPRVVKQERTFAYRFDDYWQDIGTMGAYYMANMDIIARQPAFSLNGATPVLTADEDHSQSRIFKQASVRNSIIGAGCVIKGHVENSILSPGVWVEEQAVVRNSVVMYGGFVGYHSIVNSSVLDERVNIGDFCYIGFGSGPASNEPDLTILGKDVKVPPHTAVGRNCRVLPHVGHTDFSARAVPSGATISPRASVMNVPIIT